MIFAPVYCLHELGVPGDTFDGNSKWTDWKTS